MLASYRPDALRLSAAQSEVIRFLPRRSTPQMPLLSVEVLRAMIEEHLQHLSAENRGYVLPRLIDHFADLLAQTKDAASIEDIHNRVLVAVFGEDYFRQMRGGEVDAEYERKLLSNPSMTES